jgi:hypothetical protein
VDNWNNITNFQNRVRKKSFGGTFCFSNCHIIRLDMGGLVFLVSDRHLAFAKRIPGHHLKLAFHTNAVGIDISHDDRTSTEADRGQRPDVGMSATA